MTYPYHKYIACTLACILLMLLQACSVYSSKKPNDTDGLRDIIPTKEKDRAPKNPKNVDHVKDAVPRVEVRTKAGNKSPYKVKGIVYRVMDKPDGYTAKGLASWYGLKFQGNPTSNGERYDIYGMTAAHKTLPIPSYVRVTNLENKRSVVVRVNDRGPFAPGRIIDLSYAAAYKLDIINKGTGPVRVDYIDPVAYHRERKSTLPQTAPIAQSVSNVKPKLATPPSVMQAVDADKKSVGLQATAQKTGQLFLQVGAFQDRISAFALQRKTSSVTRYPVNVQDGKTLDDRDIFRVQVGPIVNDQALQDAKRVLIEAGIDKPVRVVK